MNTRRFLCASILACMMAVGCEKKETPKAPPPTAPPVPQAHAAAPVSASVSVG